MEMERGGRMTVIRAYVIKGTDDASDFEDNHKSDVEMIDKVMFGRGTITFLKKVDYSTFKSYIDGQTITWSDVKCKELQNFYELYLEVN